jgi:hypothetical protein
MLDDRKAEFISLVWNTVRRTGRNAPAIADELIGKAFPKTYAASEEEGADKMLRTGVIVEVRRIVREKDSDDDQIDMSEIEETFRPYAKALAKGAYYVEQMGLYLTVQELISNPDYLDDARKHMRRKGEETLAEADKLDALYEAVMATMGAEA